MQQATSTPALDEDVVRSRMRFAAGQMDLLDRKREAVARLKDEVEEVERSLRGLMNELEAICGAADIRGAVVVGNLIAWPGESRAAYYSFFTRARTIPSEAA
jgi:hypothetical protein